MGSIILGYDPDTLSEKVDLLEAGRRMDELGDLRSIAALTEKATLLRLVGRLDDAWDVANEVLRLVRFMGDRETLLEARILRAQVQWAQGRLADAEKELGLCVDEASAHEWGLLQASALLERGRTRFARGERRAALTDLRASAALYERLAPDGRELIAAQSLASLVEE